jgi:phage-related minor tail protein
MTNDVESRIHIDVTSSGVAAVKKGLDDLIGSETELATAVERTRKVRERESAALERLARRVDPEYNAQQRRASDLALLNRAQASGLATTSAYEKSLARLTAVQNDNTRSVGLARHEWINLSRQFQDVGVSLAGGASPFLVLTQQGSQIADVFSSSGAGAGAALRAFGATALRVAANPITLFVAGAAAAAATAYQWQKATDALTVSLNGLGRASGVTVEGASRIAATSAAQSGISLSAARGLASQFLGAGVGGANLGGAIGLTNRFGRKLGVTNEDAAGILGSAIADPARGAEELSKKFGLLSLAQREQIATLAALGDRSGAASRLIEDVNESLKGLEDPTYSVVREFERLKNTASDFLSSIGRFFAGGDSRTVSLEDERRKDAAQRTAQSALERAALDQGVIRQRGLDTIAQDARLAAQEITAQTYAQREAVISERERAEVLRDTANATKAALTAEGERLKLLAQSQRALDDYVRAGQQERSLLGKTSFQRGLQEIDNRYGEFQRKIPIRASSASGATIAASGPSAATKSMEALLRTAQARGMEPTEANFAALQREGVGQSFLKGRLLSGASAMSSTVDMPGISGPDISGGAARERNAQRQAFITEAQTAPLREFNKELEAEARLLDAQRDSFFKSTEEVAKATKQQELINQFMLDGVPITAAMSSTIESLAERHGRLAAAQEKVVLMQNRLKMAVDAVRDSARDALGGFVSDLQRGANAGEALNGVLDRIQRKALDIASTSLTDSLFGSSSEKGAGSGLFSGALKTLGGLFGGGSSGGAGAFSSPLFSGSSFSFGFADGGVMTSRGPVPLRRYAGGGVANSPQLAMFGEGGGAEAYVPLPDGRRIPAVVDMRGGEQSQPNIAVHNYAAGVEVTPQMTPDGVAIIVQSALQGFRKQMPGMISDSQRRANF